MEVNTIVREKDGTLLLENDKGCRLQFHFDGRNWGLGTFYYQGMQTGSTITCFAQEETVGTQYCAQSYRIMENTAEKGSVCFTGVDGKLRLDVTVSLGKGSCCYELTYSIDPLHPVFHPLYVCVPFSAKRMEFLKYPYEDTIRPDCGRRLCYVPDRGRAPLLFGRERVQEKPVFVGVGYHLEDPYINGRMEFDPLEDNAVRIFSPFQGMARAIDLQCVTKLELLRADLEREKNASVQTFRILLSTAGSQFDCIRGYMASCGYSSQLEIRHSIDESKRALLRMYKDCNGYIPGIGYHQLIRFDTGNYDTTVPHGWYSKYIVTGPQILLAYELYRYWELNPVETWARERAFEMADFLIRMQESDGMFTNWDTDMNGISIMHPNDVEGTEFNSCIYSVSDMCLGIYHLSMLCREVKRAEGLDKADWQAGIALALDALANLVQGDGELGRNYNRNGRYDKLTSAIIEALQMFNDASRETGDEKFAQARDRLETWLFDRYLSVNDWSNGSVDGGAWQGGGWPPPHNNDLMGVFTYASYCVERYRECGDCSYIQKAKDAVAYIWASVVPVDLEGFSRRTRSLVREQDFYSIYGVLVRGNDSIESLPYLSKITGDPFFMLFYRIILQTQMDYQAFNRPYAGFHIGLECDFTGRNPIDKVAEGNSGYIVRFASEFLKSVNSPLAYRYVGGEGWGLGADYHLAFDPALGQGAPYVLCASTMVRNLVWDSKKKELSILLYDTEHAQGEVEICFDPALYDPERITVKINDGLTECKHTKDHERVLAIPYVHASPSLMIKIQF